MKRIGLAALLLLLPLVPGAACSSKSDDSGNADAGDSGADTQTYPPLDPACDPLVPSMCGFPFPSNYTTVADAKTKTGLRIAFKAEALPTHNGKPTDPSAWADLDGFSATGNITTDLPGATITGLPTQDTLDVSLSATSPTVLIDATTGARIPHWAELDESIKGEDEKVFIIRPVVRLKDSTRYIVGIRDVVDAAGKPLPASPAFVALRDGGTFNHPSIEARRTLYADIFGKLDAAGVKKGELQIAWDFTTGSKENHTDWMVKMRDDALKIVGDEGPKYRITETKDNPSDKIARRIVGMMTVPLYLDKADVGGKLVFGDDGLPKQNGTAEFEFVVWIPNAATKGTPGALLQNGHGLLGSKFEGGDGYLADIADRTNMVAFSVDLVGMASPDRPTITDTIVGDIGKFRDVVGRQHQGLINELLAMRMMMGGFAKDPAVMYGGKSAIDPTMRFYRGDSQGGIFGGTYMSISTDVTRGLLSVPGAPYSLLLNRSADFGPFFFILGTVYETSADVQLALGLVQLLWDKTDPGGYMAYLADDTLPGTPKHQILIHPAIGDHQVTPLGAEWMARAVGARRITPAVRPIWGLEDAVAPYAGSAIVEFDFGLPEAPKTNVPPTKGEDPHELPRRQLPAIDQANTFFREGVVKQFCDGACDPG
jgi:hypothetical protein